MVVKKRPSRSGPAGRVGSMGPGSPSIDAIAGRGQVEQHEVRGLVAQIDDGHDALDGPRVSGSFEAEAEATRASGRGIPSRRRLARAG